MSINRRDFLRAGMTAGTLVAAPHWLGALDRPSTRLLSETPPMPIADPSVRELAMRALEAARAAGAAYADVRLTHTRKREFDMKGPRVDMSQEEAWLDVGVRALVNGYWGFAASALWAPDELARIGREAVHQAKTNARVGRPRPVELAQTPTVKDSHWTTAVERDPFEVPDGEIQDVMRSMAIYMKRKGPDTSFDPIFTVRFQRQDKAFASSEGSYCTQRLYQTRNDFGVVQGGSLRLLSPIIDGASGGWEYIRQAPLREEVRRLIAELKEDLALPGLPVEVGRYDVVFDAWSMANLLDGTLGAATELDRAMGYEANAGGTSYLNDPVTMLGSYRAGAPVLAITGDRTARGGLATVKWDDEGVEPEPFALVKDGVLVDFQTHREGAGWLKEAKGGTGAGRSHACAAAPRAFDAPLIHTPNLTLAPGAEALDFDGLVGGLKNGIAVKQLGAKDYAPFDMDFQCLNGLGTGRPLGVYQVKNGKRVARIEGAGFLFRSPDLWQGLLALGGAASQQPFTAGREKGEPAQETFHTVTAVPALIKQVTTIEFGRR